MAWHANNNNYGGGGGGGYYDSDSESDGHYGSFPTAYSGYAQVYHEPSPDPSPDPSPEPESMNDQFAQQYLLASPLTDAHLVSPNSPSRIVYRAALPDMSWDYFAPFTRHTDPYVQWRMWAKTGRNAAKWWHPEDLDRHIGMGWDTNAWTPFISFSCDLEWAVYYTLKQEFVGGQFRKLYQAQVPEDHILWYDGENSTLRSFVDCASEVFAHRFVDVYSYQELQIDSNAWQASEEWFFDRGDMVDPTYPFVEWCDYMRDVL